MPEESVEETVRKWFVALSRGDPAPRMCDPAIEVTNWEESPVPGPYVGHDGVRLWWSDLEDSIEGAQFRLEAIEPVDEHRVVSIQRLIGVFRHTGIELDWRWGSIISVAGGKITSAVGYSTPGQARRAAGLDPEDSPPTDD